MIHRRNFLKGALACALMYPFGNLLAAQKDERVLSLLNTHTGEALEVKYFANGSYDQAAIDQLSYLLRCHYTNEVKPYDVKLFDFLYNIREQIGSDLQIHVISGYRSPVYNSQLINNGHRVAKNSYHLKGRAIDFVIPGFDTGDVARLARSLSTGGVGSYSSFVHIDDGPLRQWG